MATDAGRAGADRPQVGDLPAVRVAAALARAGGTVTAFLEALAGERIDADVLSQRMTRTGPDPDLGLHGSEPVLERAALLTGHRTRRVFAYAESRIATARLPEEVVRCLHQGHEPIGRILVERGIDPRRELVDGTPVATGSDMAGPVASGAALARATLITVRARPVARVNEWFLDTVVEALDRRG